MSPKKVTKSAFFTVFDAEMGQSEMRGPDFRSIHVMY